MSVKKFYFDGVDFNSNDVFLQLLVTKSGKRCLGCKIQISELQKDLVEDAFNQLKAAVLYDRELSSEFNSDDE